MTTRAYAQSPTIFVRPAEFRLRCVHISFVAREDVRTTLGVTVGIAMVSISAASGTLLEDFPSTSVVALEKRDTISIALLEIRRATRSCISLRKMTDQYLM